MKLQNAPFPMATIAALATMFFLAGCERPLVPLPVASKGVATASPAAPAEPAARLVPATLAVSYTGTAGCNLEQVDGQGFVGKPIEIKSGREFAVVGFALLEKRQAVPTDVKLRLLSEGNARAWEGDIKGRVDRPDIPQYFKLGAWAANAGVEQLFSSAGLPPGTYHLVFTFSDGSDRLICDNGRYLTILP